MEGLMGTSVLIVLSFVAQKALAYVQRKEIGMTYCAG